LPLRSTTVVETCRASASGSGPSEATQAAKPPIAPKTNTATESAAIVRQRLPRASWPGLSRPSTTLAGTPSAMDARDKPGHEGTGVVG